MSALGHEATVTENWIAKDRKNIIFGTELLAPNQPESLPPGTVIYNLEQSTHPAFGKVMAIAFASKATVWDYSLSNVEKWRQQGIYARHVPIGYTPILTRIPKAETQDIDVLFLGWMTPRREKILADLRAAGLKVVASSNCYGGARDNLVSRAKVCLNVHHDGRNLFEIVRISYYLANGKNVVSEVSADDDEYRDIAVSLFKTEYDDLVRLCKLRVNEPVDAYYLHAFRSRDFTATISKALTDLTPQEKVAQRFALAKQSGDMKDFVDYIKDHAKGTCMEIGVRDGASTSAFLAGLEQNGGVLLSVDVQDCSGLFQGHPQWKFLQSSSQNPKLRVPELDVLLIDGDHTRTGYRADLDRYFPLVKPGGLILSHDISPNPSRTLEAVPGSDYPSFAIRDEYFAFAARHNLEHYQLPGENGMGVLIKGEPVESDESWEASAALQK